MSCNRGFKILRFPILSSRELTAFIVVTTTQFHVIGEALKYKAKCIVEKCNPKMQRVCSKESDGAILAKAFRVTFCTSFGMKRACKLLTPNIMRIVDMRVPYDL